MASAFIFQSDFNAPLDCWDTSQVTNMASMFQQASSFNQSIAEWNTSQVTNMASMFQQASSFNQSIAEWNTSQVKNMDLMFVYAGDFNQSIAEWNTSQVTNMELMFAYAGAFNQHIDRWNTSKVTNMYGMFGFATSFDQSIAKWNTSQVENMSYMFYEAASFNKSIDSWDVSQVKNMERMFSGAGAFNQSIDSWDVSQVKNMKRMFSGAGAFNQCLSTWAEKTPDNVQTKSMFVSSNCPEVNRVSKIGPWCQNFEQGCFAPGLEPSASPSTSSAPTFESVSHELCENFAVHAQTTVTFDGVTSTVHYGDVGVYPGTSITGSHQFENGGDVVLGSPVFANHVVEAHATALEHHNDEQTMEIEIGGMTFLPGIYRSGSAINFAHGTEVTLDGNGESNPEFIFIAGSTLVTAADTTFILTNGAKAENVVWALGTAATLGARSRVAGSIMAGTAITFGTNSKLYGCALAQSAVTFESGGSVVLNHYETNNLFV